MGLVKIRDFLKLTCSEIGVLQKSNGLSGPDYQWVYLTWAKERDKDYIFNKNLAHYACIWSFGPSVL